MATNDSLHWFPSFMLKCGIAAQALVVETLRLRIWCRQLWFVHFHKQLKDQETMATQMQTLHDRHLQLKSRLGFDVRAIVASALVIWMGFALFHHRAVAQTPGSNNANSTAGSSLGELAPKPPPGEQIVPKMQSVRFSDQMLEILQSRATEKLLNDTADRLAHSSDPLVRLTASLQLDMVHREARLQELPGLVLNTGLTCDANVDAYSASHPHAGHTTFGWIRSANQSDDDHNPNRNGLGHNPELDADRKNDKGEWGYEGMIRVPDADPEYDKHVAELRAPAEKIREEYAAAPLGFRQCMQELEKALRQAAVQAVPDTNLPSGISVKLGDQINTQGMVILKNESKTTLHHCLLLVHSEEDPSKAFLSPFMQQLNDLASNGKDGPTPAQEENARIAKMPVIYYTYRDTFAPGDQETLPACYSKNILGITALNASIWSDEIGVENIDASNLNDIHDIISKIKVQQSATNDYGPIGRKQQVKPETLNDKQVGMQARNNQHKSVYIIAGDGVLLYQFLAYPKVLSEAIVVPENNKHFDIAFPYETPPQCISDGQQTDPKSPTCMPGSRLRFRSMGDQPIPVAVRFISRDLTDAEQQPFVMPPYPPAAAVPPSPQQKNPIDAIINFVKKNRTLSGNRTTGNIKTPVQITLTWDDELAMAKGVITVINQPNPKDFEGRIIDNKIDPPFLQLVEFSPTESGTGRSSNGNVNSLQLSTDGLTLSGPWKCCERTRFRGRLSVTVTNGTISLQADPGK